MSVCVLGLATRGNMEGLHNLVVLFSETMFIMVPVMPRSS